MGEISIKVSIANRIYPLKVKISEEEVVRKAVKLINDKIKDYEDNFSVRDKQDLLAMCAIQLATEVIGKPDVAAGEIEKLENSLSEIDLLLDEYLQEKEVL